MGKGSSSSNLKSSVVFEGIEEAFQEDGANLVKRVKGIFGFKVKGVEVQMNVYALSFLQF